MQTDHSAIEHNSVRLFFGIKLSKPDATNIAHWRKTHWPLHLLNNKPAKAIPTENFHITLLFLGALPNILISPLIKQCQQLRIPQLCFTLNRYGLFSKPKVAWLGLSKPHPGLESLHLQLKQQATSILPENHPATKQLQSPQRYMPHLSLFRHTRSPLVAPSLAPNFTLQCHTISLFKSQSTPDGVQYIALHNWASNHPTGISS